MKKTIKHVSVIFAALFMSSCASISTAYNVEGVHINGVYRVNGTSCTLTVRRISETQCPAIDEFYVCGQLNCSSKELEYTGACMPVDHIITDFSDPIL